MSESIFAKNVLKAMGWKISNSLFFSLISIISIYANKTMTSAMSLFLGMFFSCLVIIPFMVYKKTFTLPNKLNSIFYIARALLGSLSMWLWFLALEKTSVNQAVAITYSIPLMTTFLAILCLKEKPTTKTVTALILGTIGICIIFYPHLGNYQSGAWLALLSSFGWAINDVMLKVQTEEENSINQVFWLQIIRTVTMLPIIIYSYDIFALSAIQLSWGIILGILFAINLVVLFLSYYKVPIVLIMPISFSRIIISFLFAHFLFGEVMSLNVLIGCSIIFLSHFSLIHSWHKKTK